MDAEFYSAITSDTLLSAVLLGLFIYASRIARDGAGILAWGWGHFTYTLGSALIDAGAHHVVAGQPNTTLNLLASGGAVLSNCGLVGLAWSITIIAEQRALRRREWLWMAVAAATGAAIGAWFLFTRQVNFAAPALSMTLFELFALAVITVRLRHLSRVPYRLPARLIQAGCLILFAMYATDLWQIVGADRFARYVPDVSWVKADLSLWFLMNFCMLMIVSFRAVESYRQSAHVDPLTGLLNRRGLQALLRQRLDETRGPVRTPVAVLMLDLDHFKAVNDRYGHAAGDAVLRIFSAALERTVRGGDLTARVGGEEFAVFLVDASPEAARELAERLRLRVAELALGSIRPGLRVTVSIGIATGLMPGAPVQVLMDDADAALYAAKAAGRNRVMMVGESN
jgi:diguanylate cyclase (GGDEF)-like protein